MKIKDLKQPYKALALVRQKEQGRNQDEDTDMSYTVWTFNWLKTKEGHDWWQSTFREYYPPIPPDSLKDIPLQVRWDSGERFVNKWTQKNVTELNVLKVGKICASFEGGSADLWDNENSFFSDNEPITEPQTRWVTTMVEKDGSFKTVLSDGVIVGFSVVFSVQQQLINSKWVNV